MTPVIFTVGHSTRSVDELVEILRAHGVERLVDVRTHRSLIADALTARGYKVRDILSTTSAKPHVLKPMARVHGQHVTYPAEATNME